MRPARYDLQWHAGIAQLVDARGIGTALAAQYQQRVDRTTGALRIDQRDRHLRRATGKTAGDEVDDAKPPSHRPSQPNRPR